MTEKENKFECADRCTFYERTMDGVPAMGADVRWIETRLEFPIVGDAGVTCVGSA